jgi:drug/metabolite transporter (DMT)-like permease
MITIQLAISSISLLPIYLISDPFALEIMTAPLFSILSLGVFASGIAYVWNTQVISFYGSARASSVSYLIPLVALVSGFLFLGENPTSSQLIGGGVILLGIWLSKENQTSE